jgi:hypothetical protein
MAEAETPDPLAKFVLDRWEELKNARHSWKAHWEEVERVMLPLHTGNADPDLNGGKKRYTAYDGIGGLAVDLLAAGLHGMVSNPASQWFDLGVAGHVDMEEDDPLREELTHERHVMTQAMHTPGASITTHLHEAYISLGAFGTAVMWIGNSKLIDPVDLVSTLNFETIPMAQCCIDENADGVVDTVHREQKPTVRQLVQTHGLKNVSEASRKLWQDGKFHEKVTTLHAVFPKDEWQGKRFGTKAQRFASVLVEVDNQHVLERKGVEEFPYAVPRWVKSPGQVYGRSPAMAALPDVKMLDEMTKTFLRTLQKQADPTLLIHSDSTLNRYTGAPGGVLYWRGDEIPQHLQVGGELRGLAEFMDGLRTRILQTFHVDQLQMIADVDMTATEVIQRTQERMRMLGPVLGRLETELLGPIVRRVYGLMQRRGAFNRVDEFRRPVARRRTTERLVPQYTSPLAQAQRGVEVNNALSFVQILTNVAAQTENKRLQAWIDDDRIGPWLGHAIGANAKIIRSRDEYEKKVKQIEAGEQMMGLAAGAATARDAAAAAKDFAAAGMAR